MLFSKLPLILKLQRSIHLVVLVPTFWFVGADAWLKSWGGLQKAASTSTSSDPLFNILLNRLRRLPLRARGCMNVDEVDLGRDSTESVVVKTRLNLGIYNLKSFADKSILKMNSNLKNSVWYSPLKRELSQKPIRTRQGQSLWLNFKNFQN